MYFVAKFMLTAQVYVFICLQRTACHLTIFISHVYSSCFVDEQRFYGFARIETGDEMSRRIKFVFITWIGDKVSPLKKARVSTDKGNIKHYITVSMNRYIDLHYATKLY